jgi:D-beta-D-heptose 7-phosphate kinase/D-beta-D-heptose 1-phosphate adenosyltransferase
VTPESIEKALSRIAGLHVAVVGDVMLDEYVWGEVSRISPDAPVQVVEVRRRTHAAGGAANVALNVAAAGARASLFGVVGKDAAGETLLGLAEAAGVDVRHVTVDPARPTTVKTRVLARNQHVLRMDQEVRGLLPAAVRGHLVDSLRKALGGCDAVLVSDYAKGVVDEGLVPEIAAMARRAGRPLPVIVDPKSHDFARYRGCDGITPNQRESEIAAQVTIGGEEDLREVARRLRERCGAPWVLITRGEKGMALSDGPDSLHLVATKAREVYDVTGAGDTVLAYFGLGVSAGLPPVEAAALSNIAAGVGVGRVGTTRVSGADIVASLIGSPAALRKVVDLHEAAERVDRERARGRRIVFTNGCFDLLHAGHVHLLEQAAERGDFLVVAINSDASVSRLKGEGRPLVGEADRVKILAALDAVDLVLVFGEDTPLEAIRAVHPDVLVKGGDYTTDTIVGHELVQGWGGIVEAIPLVQGRSTSALITAIRKGGES